MATRFCSLKSSSSSSLSLLLHLSRALTPFSSTPTAAASYYSTAAAAAVAGAEAKNSEIRREKRRIRKDIIEMLHGLRKDSLVKEASELFSQIVFTGTDPAILSARNKVNERVQGVVFYSAATRKWALHNRPEMALERCWERLRGF